MVLGNQFAGRHWRLCFDQYLVLNNRLNFNRLGLTGLVITRLIVYHRGQPRSQRGPD